LAHSQLFAKSLCQKVSIQLQSDHAANKYLALFFFWTHCRFTCLKALTVNECIKFQDSEVLFTVNRKW